MILAQGRFWRAALHKGGDAVTLSILKESLPPELGEVKDVRIDVPISEWQRVVKQARPGRKLLGGILLDFARSKEHLSAAIASDRLFHSLQGLLVDATISLVEEGLLNLTAAQRES